MLRTCRSFARAYIDDIIIFLRLLKEHLEHLDRVFGILYSLGIYLAPKKSFLGYLSIVLLGQRVDRYRLTTSSKKLEAI